MLKTSLLPYVYIGQGLNLIFIVSKSHQSSFCWQTLLVSDVAATMDTADGTLNAPPFRSA